MTPQRIKSVVTVLVLMAAISCGKDDGPTVTTPVNSAPVIEDNSYSFSIDENSDETVTIGTVAAKDSDGDTLIFTITNGNTDGITNGFFKIDGNGNITLDSNNELDYETLGSTIFSLTIEVSDNVNEPVIVTVTITVNDVPNDPGELALKSDSFITKWKTSSVNELVAIGTWGGEFDYTIDWGDGTVEENSTNPNPSHTYETPNTYTVAISGMFPSFGVSDPDEDGITLQCVSIEQWGDIVWEDLGFAFSYFDDFAYNAQDNPNLSNGPSLRWMFQYVSTFNKDISGWNVSQVTDMSYMFRSSSFNGNISEWDVSSVSNMKYMFFLSPFNGSIGNWNVSNVTDMEGMFSASPFNQDIGNWNVTKVGTMFNMFRDSGFDKSLGNWDISNKPIMQFFLTDSAMSPQNYSATLVGWATQEPDEGEIPDSAFLVAEGVNYCSDYEGITEVLNFLENDKSWTIIDDGGIDCFNE